MIDEKEFEEFVYVSALENAVSFNGKANSKALIGRVIPKFPDVKKDMAYYMNVINNIVDEVNSMSEKAQKERLLERNPQALEKKKTEPKKNIDELIDLPGHEGKIVTRFCPAPSGHLHLGHLFGIIYNYEYVKKYGGKFILRIEDTNPENIDIKNYEKIIEDVKWITENGVDEIFYQSDRLDIYYKYLRQLVETNNAYVCECDPEVFKNFNDSSEPCPHRDLSVEENMENYEKFFNKKYKEGQAILRFKADLENKNPALRDFPLARIKEGKHARVGTKYHFWPMYNFCCAIDDSLMGINYIIRGKDHEINGLRQDMIKDALNIKKSKFFHYGRMKFTDLELSKTKLSEKIENKVYSGWDDPRVPSLISYRRRGYKPQAFRQMIVRMGISKRDSKISDSEYHKNLDFFNKQILEKESNRYFFVHNPKKVVIKDLGEYNDKEINLPKHPEDKSRGSRIFKLEKEYLIDSIDFDNINKGDVIRLMHFANFNVKDKDKDKLMLNYHSKDFDRELGVRRNIHFISTKNETCEIVMQDNSKLKGYCENLGNIKEDTNVQFERFGFARLDEVSDKKKVFYFTHR